MRWSVIILLSGCMVGQLLCAQGNPSQANQKDRQIRAQKAVQCAVQNMNKPNVEIKKLCSDPVLKENPLSGEEFAKAFEKIAAESGKVFDEPKLRAVFEKHLSEKNQNPEKSLTQRQVWETINKHRYEVRVCKEKQTDPKL